MHCSQLNGQRKPVHLLADRLHQSCRIGSSWAQRLCSLTKEADRVIERQGTQRKFLLTAHVQGPTARHQDGQTRAACQQIRDEGRCLQHLLEIVEDQEEVPGPQVGADLRREWSSSLLTHLGPLADGAWPERGLPTRGTVPPGL